jgi:hypothetical protein
LVARVKGITQAHGLSLGGWVDVGVGATYLAGSLDFLGGMVYSYSPRSLRAMLPRMGENDLVCLLWGLEDPRSLEQEAREAVHAGAPTVGFWVRAKDGGYEESAAQTAAMRRALAGVEDEWLRFYREQILAGDGRFAVVSGTVGRDELRLRVRNTGRAVPRRVLGELGVNLPRPDAN